MRGVLAQEIHHRVKNNLQTVASLLRLQARARPTSTRARRSSDSVNRILAIAAVHEVLTERREEDVELAELLDRLRAMLVQGLAGGKEVARSLEPVSLAGDRATALALVFSELLQNALEHGGSTVRVELARANGDVVLAIADDGEGSTASRAGTGLSIVRALVRDELGGELSLDSNGGCEPRSSFRLARLPELEAVALGVVAPGEPAVLLFLLLVVDAHAGLAQLRDHRVEVADAVVEHRRLLARPVVARRREDAPDRLVAGVRDERLAAPVLHVDAEVLRVPLAQPLGVARAEEHPADPDHALHRADPTARQRGGGTGARAGQAVRRGGREAVVHSALDEARTREVLQRERERARRNAERGAELRKAPLGRELEHDWERPLLQADVLEPLVAQRVDETRRCRPDLLDRAPSARTPDAAGGRSRVSRDELRLDERVERPAQRLAADAEPVGERHELRPAAAMEPPVRSFYGFWGDTPGLFRYVPRAHWQRHPAGDHRRQDRRPAEHPGGSPGRLIHRTTNQPFGQLGRNQMESPAYGPGSLSFGESAST
jgi:two-component sensor histidine kinase